MNMKSNYLVGKTIQDIKIAKDQKAILFVTNAGEIIVRTDGDCCSSTWVENINAPALGFPCYVFSAEDIDMPDLGQNDYGRIAYYGFKIGTDKGSILIDYRNESNGYYGGNLCWGEDDHFYGGVYGQNISKEEWVNIK